MFHKFKQILLYLILVIVLMVCMLSIAKESWQPPYYQKFISNSVINFDGVFLMNDLTTTQQPPNYAAVKTVVLFIGYPRSGSTLIGSLLDAHANVVIANEYNLLRRNFTKVGKEYIFEQLWKNSVEEMNKQRSPTKKHLFHYHVPGLRQGGYDGHVQVIGDKKAMSTTRILASKSHRYAQLREKMTEVDIRFIHLIRNPFDNIATMLLQTARGLRRKAYEQNILYDHPTKLRRQAAIYTTLIDSNAQLRQRFRGTVLDVYYSNLVTKPHDTLRTVCNFLQLACTPEYLERAARVVFKNETFTRRYVHWHDEVVKTIEQKINQTDFLRGFKFKIR